MTTPSSSSLLNTDSNQTIAFNSQECARARRARDARFDGLFFVAVKTTGIYCRPICPATPALEKNVNYYESAIGAAQAGFRPCMRCRPDSSPNSSAWRGNETTLTRAISLIQQGDLSDSSLQALAERLGVSDRYVRKLFSDNLGVSTKQFALYQQCLFAKKLLQETQLPVGDVAFAAGFNSVRRFNDAIKQQLSLTPRELRKQALNAGSDISLQLSYRPPYDTASLMSFLQTRCIAGLESSDGVTYRRTFVYDGGKTQVKGQFCISPSLDTPAFDVTIQLEQVEVLYPVVQRIKALFDVDAPIAEISGHLQSVLGDYFEVNPGLRVPGVWGLFETGVRAVLGQQVTVTSAKKLVTQMVHELGEKTTWFTHKVDKGFGEELSNELNYFFPTPEAVLGSDLSFLKMPGSRKETLHRLANHMLNDADPSDIDRWVDVKGIGPWTVNYVKLRALKDPDVWLAGDSGIKNALKKTSDDSSRPLEADDLKPWRSYATLQLWNQL